LEFGIAAPGVGVVVDGAVVEGVVVDGVVAEGAVVVGAEPVGALSAGTVTTASVAASAVRRAAEMMFMVKFLSREKRSTCKRGGKNRVPGTSKHPETATMRPVFASAAGRACAKLHAPTGT